LIGLLAKFEQHKGWMSTKTKAMEQFSHCPIHFPRFHAGLSMRTVLYPMPSKRFFDNDANDMQFSFGLRTKCPSLVRCIFIASCSAQGSKIFVCFTYSISLSNF
jgi:hypothetical protein